MNDNGRYRYVWIAGAVLGAMLVMAACNKDKEAPPKEGDKTEADVGDVAEPAPSGPAQVTFVHAALGVETVQVLINGVPLEGVEPLEPFEGKTVRAEVPSGTCLLAVAPPPVDERPSTPKPPPLVTRSVTFEPATSYLVLIGGVYGERGRDDQPLALFALRDEGPTEIVAGKTLLRAVHGVVNAPPLDISSSRAKGDPALALVNVGFGKSSAFHPVPAGPELLEFRSGLDTKAKPLYEAQNAVLPPDTRATLMLVGKVGSKAHPLRLWLMTPDAENARSL
ncbi:MAG: DUF4397 domain-containing protein [Myxococcota bacterium]